jgi:hypothetical protein
MMERFNLTEWSICLPHLLQSRPPTPGTASMLLLDELSHTQTQKLTRATTKKDADEEIKKKRQKTKLKL